MRMARRILILTLGIMFATVMACKFSASTANLSSFKVAKDKAASQEASTFSPGDTVYGVATVSNAPGAIKVKGTLVAEDVKGISAGPIPGLETTVDLPGSGTATFTFTPPPAGWPTGKYKINVVMLNENGEQKDQKTASFTVS